jgi:hypothetical protein
MKSVVRGVCEIHELARQYCWLCLLQDSLIEQQYLLLAEPNQDPDEIKNIEVHIKQRGKTLQRTWQQLAECVSSGVVTRAELEEQLRLANQWLKQEVGVQKTSGRSWPKIN